MNPHVEVLLKASRCDGKFPLLTNQGGMSADEILQAYKRQPLVEKQISQFKNDFQVAPVFLKSVSRIQALLAVYFFGEETGTGPINWKERMKTGPVPVSAPGDMMQGDVWHFVNIP